MQELKNVLLSAIPLQVIFQQCNDNEHLNPSTNKAAWLQCLQEVYVSQNYLPTIAQLADAIYNVWKSNLNAQIFSDALTYFKNQAVIQAFTAADIASQVQTYYAFTCLQLNGSQGNSFVKCGNGAALQFNGTSTYSLIIRVRFNGNYGGNLMGRLVGSSWSGGNTIGGYQLFTMGNKTIRSYRYAPPYQCDAPVTIQPGQWCFIATTFDGKTSRNYLNAVLGGSLDYTAGLTNAPANAEFMIGCSYRGNTSTLDNCLNGSVAWAAVFNTVLSADNLAAYLNNKPLANEAGLAAFWDFSKGNANDLSGNGNNGTLVGTAVFGPSI